MFNLYLEKSLFLDKHSTLDLSDAAAVHVNLTKASNETELHLGNILYF